MDEETLYSIISKCYSEKNIIKKLRLSFDDYIDWLKIYIKNNKIIESDFEVHFSNVRIKKPYSYKKEGRQILYPEECRNRKLSYSGYLLVNIIIVIIKGDKRDTKILRNVKIAEIPIMLKSSKCHLYNLNKVELISHNECYNNLYGYFLINGKRKVIITQEKISSNILFMVKRKNEMSAKIISEIDQQTRNFSIVLKKDIYCVKFQHLKKNEYIPVIIMLKAYNLLNTRDFYTMLNVITLDAKSYLTELVKNVSKNEIYYNREESINYIKKKIVEYRKVPYLLNNDILPHIGKEDTHFKQKAFFICYMFTEFVKVIKGVNSETDRDHLKYKRFEMVGELLKHLFSTLFHKFSKNIKNNLKNNEFEKNVKKSLEKCFNENIITKNLYKSIASGNWANKMTGVSQELAISNYIKLFSYLTQIVHPINTKNKQVKIRGLHNTQFGRICCYETPEGSQTGLIKHFTFLAFVSRSIPDSYILDFLSNMKYKITLWKDVIDFLFVNNYYVVFLNGKVIGFVQHQDRFVREFKFLRRRNIKIFDVSISCVYGEKRIFIWSDDKRILRPLIVNTQHNSYLSSADYKDEEDEGEDEEMDYEIEYIDINEEENCMVSFDVGSFPKKYTHYEIDKCSQFGITASILNNTNHNQSPRNMYICNMISQAIGFPCLNHRRLFYQKMHILHYPQRPITTTMHSRIVGLENLPIGQNIILAIASTDGYNQDDALIFNQSAIDRGLFGHTTFRCEEYTQKNGEIFEIPNKRDCTNIKMNKWAKWRDKNLPTITKEGLPDIGAKIGFSDITCGKTHKVKSNLMNKTKIDKSEFFNYKNGHHVEDVMISKGKFDQRICKIKFKRVRTPQIGDKFSSMHGQKGVIGMKMRQEDMPFTKDGMVVDAIINPHCIPSRMTIGQLIEMLFGRIGCLTGNIQDGTSFKECNIENVCEKLKELGFCKSGKHVMYDGKSGRRIKAKIYVGISYYLKLNHFSEEKLQARNRGRGHILTRQPVKGKRNLGGLRFGELMRQCMISHGASNFLHEKMFESSDKFKAFVCTKCGLFAVANLKDKVYGCKSCGPNVRVAQVFIPYAMKLMIQELMVTGMTPRLILK